MIAPRSSPSKTSPCALRNVDQLVVRLRVGAGSMPCCLRMFATVLERMSYPRSCHEPSIRLQPQLTFSRAIRSTRSTTSCSVGGRPVLCLALQTRCGNPFNRHSRSTDREYALPVPKPCHPIGCQGLRYTRHARSIHARSTRIVLERWSPVGPCGRWWKIERRHGFWMPVGHLCRFRLSAGVAPNNSRGTPDCVDDCSAKERATASAAVSSVGYQLAF